MAAAAISHLRRGAQRHALLHLSRRHFSNSPLTAAAPLAAAAARRLLSTTVESATSAAAGSYKPPPLDPFRAALAPSSPPLEAPPLDELPTAPSHSEAAPEQDPVDLQHEELDGLKAGVQAVRSREESPQEKEAWWLLNRAVVNYCGSAVGTVAANDPSTANHMLNYDQVFIRDFVPSAIAFLLRGESDIVKNFLLHTLQLQSWEKTVDCYSPGQGLMPASFKVRSVPLDGNNEAFEEVLDPDFGESAIGRVAPVDSGLWWIILLRAYGKITGDYALQERVDVQTGIRLILNLCLSDGFDMFPTLLVTDGSCMIDRRMGIHGHPLEIQALFYSALRCAREMVNIDDGSKNLIRVINNRLSALSFHIREYYWVDMKKINEIYRYKTEEYSHDAINKFNIYPEQIPSWLADWIPEKGGYLIGNLQPAHMDFRFFSLGNLWAIVSSLATAKQAEGILNLIETKWDDIVANMPLKICYPALEYEEWRIITGCDPKNTPWSYHNGGSWPTLLWQFTLACIKMGRLGDEIRHGRHPKHRTPCVRAPPRHGRAMTQTTTTPQLPLPHTHPLRSTSSPMLPRRALAVLLLLPLLLSSSALAQQPQPQPLHPQDRAALHGLRASLGLRARDWPDRADPCAAWAGVACRAGRVAGIRLAGLRRTRAGALRAAFAVDALRGLTALQAFNASGFPLPGPIPAWFGRGLPPSLAVLDLRSAAVRGDLPPDLGSSGSLAALVLAGNSLSGPIPASLFASKALRVLDLSNNNLTGELPVVSASAGDGPGALFSVSGNSLYGAIGDDLLVSLKKRFRVVDVSNNYFAQVVGNGSDGTVHIDMNCLTGMPSQRSRGDCQDFYKRNGSPLPDPPPGKKGVKRKHVLAGVLGATAIVAVLFLAALVFCFLKRGRRRPRGRGLEQNDDGVRSARKSSSVNPMVQSPSWAANSPPKGVPAVVDGFTYEQLHHATGGFGDDNLVKHGRSGDIYRGALESGLNVVVKKIDLKSSRKNVVELGFLGKKSHARIVPLLGHLVKDGEGLLVYKYMAKGDLTTALHRKPLDPEEGLCSLDWITRLKIAIGVAEALCFLHDECSPPLVHRDIQASSVLLEDKFEVRLGSLSEICLQPSEGSRSFFSRVLRSSKSLDKNISGPPASCSYDVYCFGKVLLEIITGNFGVSGSSDTDSEDWLASTLGYIETHDKESISNIVDPLLIVDEDHLEEVWAVSIVAKACLNPKPSRRPLARYILKALENPLRVVREELFASSSSPRIRSTSSRSSWRSAFHGHSYRYSEVQVSGKALTRKHSAESHGSDKDENSFSFKKASREMFPGSLELEDSTVM